MGSVNPSLFREMSDPFSDAGVADAAWQAFFAELGELRKKHKIPTVYIIGHGSYFAEGGEEAEFVTTGHYGNSSEAESLTAYAFGYEQARRQEKIEKLLTSKKSRKALIEK